MSESSDFKQQAKVFLKGIFGILDKMVIDTMDKHQRDLSPPQDLFQLRDSLKSVQDKFVDDSSPVLDEVEVHLEQYRSKIQDILLTRPEPSTITPDVERLHREYRETDNEE